MKGFNIGYEGPLHFRDCINMPPALVRLKIFCTKLMKEINRGRVWGSFKTPYFTTMQCSPLGLVPKQNGHKDQTDPAVHRLICCAGTGMHMAKSDIDSTFCLIPMNFRSLQFLAMKMDNQYYNDMRLPFQAASSCTIFEQL